MDADKFLAHYGVKGMKKGVRNAYDPSQDKLGNGDPADSTRTDSNNLLSTTRTTTNYQQGQAPQSTYQVDRGKVDRWLDKMFDSKVTTMRGKNASTRVKQGKVNKFMDKLFKQVVRKAKKVV